MPQKILNIVYMRANEKKIFDYIIESADIFDKLLSMTKKEASAEASKIPQFESRFNYFRSIQVLYKND